MCATVLVPDCISLPWSSLVGWSVGTFLGYLQRLRFYFAEFCLLFQAKLENVQTANALMKEDLRLSKNQNFKLQEQNFILKHDNELLTRHYEKTKKVSASPNKNGMSLI